MTWRPAPGPCLVCGAPHSTCSDNGPITVQQLPATAEAISHGLVAEQVQATLPAGSFTTATYRRPKGKRP